MEIYQNLMQHRHYPVARPRRCPLAHMLRLYCIPLSYPFRPRAQDLQRLFRRARTLGLQLGVLSEELSELEPSQGLQHGSSSGAVALAEYPWPLSANHKWRSLRDSITPPTRALSRRHCHLPYKPPHCSETKPFHSSRVLDSIMVLRRSKIACKDDLWISIPHRIERHIIPYDRLVAGWPAADDVGW